MIAVITLGTVESLYIMYALYMYVYTLFRMIAGKASEHRLYFTNNITYMCMSFSCWNVLHRWVMNEWYFIHLPSKMVVYAIVLNSTGVLYCWYITVSTTYMLLLLVQCSVHSFFMVPFDSTTWFMSTPLQDNLQKNNSVYNLLSLSPSL